MNYIDFKIKVVLKLFYCTKNIGKPADKVQFIDNFS